jgi:hypothetical protein
MASLEAEHLAFALRALRLWVDPAEVTVLDNASRPEASEAITRLVDEHGMRRMRLHDLTDGSNTTVFLHDAIIRMCREHPDETILKLDEDVVFVGDGDRIRPGRRELWVPNVTVNNFTSKFYVRHLWPELYDEIADNEQPWHHPSPGTGREYKLELMRRFYDTEPETLAALCDEHPGVERIGRRQWRACRLVGGYLREKRGISSMAIAFRAQDYLDLIGRKKGIEEVLLANAVFKRRAHYVVDRGAYCHHVNYWSIRPQIQEMGEHVARYNERVLDLYAARSAA